MVGTSGFYYADVIQPTSTLFISARHQQSFIVSIIHYISIHPSSYVCMYVCVSVYVSAWLSFMLHDNNSNGNKILLCQLLGIISGY